MTTISKQKDFHWQGRIDEGDASRLHQKIRQGKLLPRNNCKNIALLGFCSDEGVRRNGGRPGAKEGPNAIRQALCNKVLHESVGLVDMGDVICESDLESAQHDVAKKVSQAQALGFKTMLLGGGHEIAFAHFKGLHEAYADHKIGIINIDAHLDVRPLIDGKGSSGTPFLQAYNHCKSSQTEFAYLALGIQPQANTPSLFDTMNTIGGHYAFASDMMAERHLENTLQKTEHFVDTCDKIYVTICLDAFSASIAPGVSAPQSLGLTADYVLPILNFLKKQEKIIAIDVAELNPKFDADNKTANLAADLLVYLL